ncbi:MAG: lamin tail domain-containing protein [Ignavibacteria bacterium]|nr:lamin tail domain-containing protein [Ignavibacteria bacterium]
MKKFVTNPVSPVAGGFLTLSFVVANSGLNIATNSSLKIYDDRNLDSIIQQSELINSFELTSLEPDDSTSNEMTVQELLPGKKQFIALINYQPDQDTLDNKLFRSVFVSEPGQAGSIVINEIMYEPLTGQVEWIELLNPSSATYDLKEWQLTDNSGANKITDSPLVILPGGYLIISSDSSLMNYFSYLKNPDELISIVVVSSLSLNNSGETITVADSLLTEIDKCSYSPSMHNPEIEDTRGISLERINPALPSSYLYNWSSSANSLGATPGRKNSIFANANSVSSDITISPNPFSPDGDGTDDVAVINCKFAFTKGTIRANIYDIRGRMIRTLANNELTGSEKTFLFNGYSDSNEKLNVGIYVVMIEAIDQVRGEPVTIKAPLVIAAKL